MPRKKQRAFKLINNDDFFLVEGFNSLRANLEYSLIDGAHKTIVITSAVPQEGKTYITANLGFSLMKIGYKVLLLDCDFRKPQLHRFFNIPSRVGITNVLFKKIEFDNAVNKISSHLHVLCSGPLPPNSIEVLNSRLMKDFIKKVSDQYDYVLIDTPPSAYLSDASVLAPNTSGVLFVIKYKDTQIDTIKQAVQNLKKVNANIIGAIISQTKIKRSKKDCNNSLLYMT